MARAGELLQGERDMKSEVLDRCDVAIIGAGPAGLAVAIASSKAGLRTRVFERAPGLERGGGALSIWPNATHVLEALEVARAVKRRATPFRCGIFTTLGLRELGRIDLEAIANRCNGSAFVVPRRHFLQVLATRLTSEVAFATSLHSFRTATNHVEFSLSCGKRIRTSVLIGADGLNSTVRDQLWGSTQLRDYGHFTVGGFSRPTRWLRRGEGLAAVGLGARFCAHHMGNVIYWLAGLFDARVRSARRRPTVRELVESFPAPRGSPIREVLQNRRDSTCFVTRIRDIPPLARWGRGRVTLVGDAAHPMTPDLGQGACQALESAYILGRSLVHRGATPHALRHYERQRKERAYSVANHSSIVTRLAMQDRLGFLALRTLLAPVFLRFGAQHEIEKLVTGGPLARQRHIHGGRNWRP